jgi:hypothetical protein
MVKNKELVNALIKKNNLKMLLGSVGIQRISSNSLNLLIEKFGEDILIFCNLLKEQMNVSGKRILDEKCIGQVLESLKFGEDIDY